MKPVYQTRKGKEGNCWAACLASLFEVPLEEVDHCAGNHADWLHQTDEWLRARGFYQVEAKWPMECTAFPDGTILICGCVSETGLNHAVIGEVRHTKKEADGQAGEIEIWVIHDPLGKNLRETYSINAIFFICPINPARFHE